MRIMALLPESVRRNSHMKSTVSRNQKDNSFCDVRLLTPSEKGSLERATAEVHETFNEMLRSRKPRFAFREREQSPAD